MRILISLLALVALLTACSRKPKTLKEQASYTIGVQFGKSLKAQALDLDPKVVGRGIVDGFNGEKSKLDDGEMQQVMIKMAEEKQKEMHAEGEKNRVIADAFLQKKKAAEGVKVTGSGLQYKVLEEGKGTAVKADDVVVVNYKGTLVDGKEFDSSYKRSQPAEFPVKGVIPGWQEGLQLMKKGAKVTFFVPPELGYGDRPNQNIPANSVLIFEVELLDIKPGAKTVGGPGAKSATAAKPSSGKKK
jgi:FKBP-type peptidyl-prolyl cis-trans isomerase